MDTSTGYFEYLPRDVLNELFDYFTPLQLLTCISITCKSFKKIVDSMPFKRFLVNKRKTEAADIILNTPGILNTETKSALIHQVFSGIEQDEHNYGVHMGWKRIILLILDHIPCGPFFVLSTRRCGKTYALVQACLYNCALRDNINVSYVCTSASPNVTATNIDCIINSFPFFKTFFQGFKYSADLRRFSFQNGSRITIRTSTSILLDLLDSSDIIAIDEPDQHTEHNINYLIENYSERIIAFGSERLIITYDGSIPEDKRKSIFERMKEHTITLYE